MVSTPEACLIWSDSLRAGNAINNPVDAIVVLGFTLQTSPDGTWMASPILEDRLRLGLRYLERNLSRTIILSGGWGPTKNQAEIMKRWIENQPSFDSKGWKLIPEGSSNTTFQNAELSLQIAQENGFRSIALATSSFHQFRSRQTFCTVLRKLGLENSISLTVLEMDAPEVGLQAVSGLYNWVRELGAIGKYISKGQMDVFCQLTNQIN